MNLRFTNWYTQALGSTLGIMACLYSYLNGDMIIYSNIDTYFDTLGFSGIISSYLLLPLCIIALFLAIIKSYSPNKKFFNVSIENINIVIIIATVIIGFMGAKIYFCIPAIFILFNIFTYCKIRKIKKNYESEECNIENHEHKKYIKHKKQTNYKDTKQKEYTLVYSDKNIPNNTDKLQILKTKIEIAKNLLEKNAKKQFIMEVTGLTLDQLNLIEKELNKIENS